ncbi:hypothetical protein FHX06_002827 [Rhizobium sp. BK512]|nr:hypothetical protein [Rhizobium sp. BK512]
MWKQIIAVLMDALRLATYTSDDSNNRHHRNS